MRTVGLAFASALFLGALALRADASPGPKHTTIATSGRAFTNVALTHARPPLPLVQGAATRLIGKSIGSPTEGHLLGGAHLDDAPYLRIVPVYSAGDVRWGLESLVGLLDRTGRSVRKAYPDAVMSVGHLSRAGGGELDRHASHESGRDADVGFYVKNHLGKPVYADHFVAFKGDGTAPSWPGAHFDDARNWAFIAALVGDGRAHVSHIFVATPIRARLLAYAEHLGSPGEIRQRAALAMVQPRGALPHDDHFHVRISCPASMEGCIGFPTANGDRLARLAHARGRTRGARVVPLGTALRGSGTPGSGIAAVNIPQAGSPPSAAQSPAAAGASGGAGASGVTGTPGTSPGSPAPAHAKPAARQKDPSRDDNADLPAIPTPAPDPQPTVFDPDEAPPASWGAAIDDVDGPLPDEAP